MPVRWRTSGQKKEPAPGGWPAWRNARTRVVTRTMHTLGGEDLYLGAIRGV